VYRVLEDTVAYATLICTFHYYYYYYYYYLWQGIQTAVGAIARLSFSRIGAIITSESKEIKKKHVTPSHYPGRASNLCTTSLPFKALKI